MVQIYALGFIANDKSCILTTFACYSTLTQMKLFFSVVLSVILAMTACQNTANLLHDPGTQAVIQSAEQIAVNYFNDWMKNASGKRGGGASKQVAMNKAKAAIHRQYPQLSDGKVNEIVAGQFIK